MSEGVASERLEENPRESGVSRQKREHQDGCGQIPRGLKSTPRLNSDAVIGALGESSVRGWWIEKSDDRALERSLGGEEVGTGSEAPPPWWAGRERGGAVAGGSEEASWSRAAGVQGQMVRGEVPKPSGRDVRWTDGPDRCSSSGTCDLGGRTVGVKKEGQSGALYELLRVRIGWSFQTWFWWVH